MAAPTLFRKVQRGVLEYRYDALTNQETRINPARATRPKQGEIDSLFEQVIKSSEERCPFCPSRILEKVPSFPKEVAPEGRIFKGETVIFPNMNPFGQSHAVGVICNAHFLPIEGFTSKILRDAIHAAQTYFSSTNKANPSITYPVLVWNYLPPSAGSIIHPHIQMLMEENPVPELKKILKRSSKYYNDNKQNYFTQLVEAEKAEKVRYIGGNDSVDVIATYAPRAYNEVCFIFKDQVSSFSQLNEKQIENFVEALTKTLLGYKNLGVGSLNMASFSAAVDDKAASTHFRLHVKLFSRPSPKGVYTNDTGPMERVYNSWVIDSVPEILAETIRGSF